jgi:hypothetical protein
MTEPDRREMLEVEFLTRLMRADAREWRRRISHNDSAAPEEPLGDEERQFMRNLRRVTHTRREEEA